MQESHSADGILDVAVDFYTWWSRVLALDRGAAGCTEFAGTMDNAAGGAFG